MTELNLQRAFELQRQLQIESYGVDPATLEGEDKIQFIKDMVLAATDELHEALGETDWKPWAEGESVNRELYIGELVDVFHFFMNLCIVVDLTPEDLLDRYVTKRTINARRQLEGYDGRSTKCPECGKALDDPAVQCHEILNIDSRSGTTVVAYWCQTRLRRIPA